MAIQIKITVDSKNVDRKLARIAVGLQDLRPAFNNIGDELTADFFGKKVFDAQGAESGGRWKSLSPRTLQARANRTGHYAKSPVATNKILVWTGALQKGFRRTVKAMSLRISNLVDYFKYNQPNRPMLSEGKGVLAIITKHMNRYIQKLIAK